VRRDPAATVRLTFWIILGDVPASPPFLLETLILISFFHQVIDLY